jgi:hypothetical protein
MRDSLPGGFGLRLIFLRSVLIMAEKAGEAGVDDGLATRGGEVSMGREHRGP